MLIQLRLLFCDTIDEAIEANKIGEKIEKVYLLE